MRIYVLGCTGMLGHKLFINFLKKSNYVIRGSSRKIPKILRKYKTEKSFRKLERDNKNNIYKKIINYNKFKIIRFN